MRRLTLMTCAALGMMSFSASATKYANADNSYDVTIDNGQIEIEFCSSEQNCTTSSANIDELVLKLSKRISEYESVLSNKSRLIKSAKQQVASADTLRINDPTAETSYVMITVGEHFNYPMHEQDANEGDFSPLMSALESTLSRYKRSSETLESEDLQQVISAGLVDSLEIVEIHNIVKFQKHI